MGEVRGLPPQKWFIGTSSIATGRKEGMVTSVPAAYGWLDDIKTESLRHIQHVRLFCCSLPCMSIGICCAAPLLYMMHEV